TLDAAIGWPSLTSSPCTRRWPQVGLSVAMRITSLWIAAVVDGRPGLRFLASTPTRPRRAHQRIQASRVEAQVKSGNRVLEPYRRLRHLREKAVGSQWSEPVLSPAALRRERHRDSAVYCSARCRRHGCPPMITEHGT